MMNEAININILSAAIPRIAVMNGNRQHRRQSWNSPEKETWKPARSPSVLQKHVIMRWPHGCVGARNARLKATVRSTNFVISTGFQVVWENLTVADWNAWVPLTLDRPRSAEASENVWWRALSVSTHYQVLHGRTNDDVEALDKALDAYNARRLRHFLSMMLQAAALSFVSCILKEWDFVWNGYSPSVSWSQVRLGYRLGWVAESKRISTWK